ncbi:MAG TPA: MFS transporter [Gemmatimonadales bacterium]
MTDAAPERIPGPVKGLSAVSLCNDFASEMVYPVLPAFVTTTLGGSAVALGALDGAADLTAAVVKWGSGRLADRPRWTKPLILAGYGVAVLVRPLISIAGTAGQVIGFRVIDRVGKGLRSPARDTLVATLTPPPVRGRAFGFHRAADHLGAVLGSLTAWVLLSRHTGVREIIGWSAVPGIVAVLLLVFVLRGVNGRRSSVDGTAPRRPPAAVPEAHARIDVTGRAFWIPVGTLVFMTVGRLPETLMLLRLQDLGLSIALIPLLWAALHVVRSAASYPGGWLSDHLGARFGMALGSLLYGGVAVALAAAGGRAWAVTVFLLHGVVAGLVEPAERVAVTKLAPVRTGRGFGDYQGLAGLAALPMGLAFGLIYRNLGGPAALLASAVCMGIATALWLGTVPTARVR